MARYFFHTVDGAEQKDADGIELASPCEARDAAIRFAGAVMNDEPAMVLRAGTFRVEVTDERHVALFSVVTTVSVPQASDARANGVSRPATSVDAAAVGATQPS